MLKYRKDGTVAANFAERVMSFNNPDLAKTDGHVYQLWEDGEVTSQKSGDLLWERNLHVIELSLRGSYAMIEIPTAWWPNHKNGYGFIYCEPEEAEMLRAELLEV